MTQLTRLELEVFSRCANILRISPRYPGRVFCQWHYDWIDCDGTKCAPQKRATPVSLEW